MIMFKLLVLMTLSMSHTPDSCHYDYTDYVFGNMVEQTRFYDVLSYEDGTMRRVPVINNIVPRISYGVYCGESYIKYDYTIGERYESVIARQRGPKLPPPRLDAQRVLPRAGPARVDPQIPQRTEPPIPRAMPPRIHTPVPQPVVPRDSEPRWTPSRSNPPQMAPIIDLPTEPLKPIFVEPVAPMRSIPKAPFLPPPRLEPAPLFNGHLTPVRPPSGQPQIIVTPRYRHN